MFASRGWLVLMLVGCGAGAAPRGPGGPVSEGAAGLAAFRRAMDHVIAERYAEAIAPLAEVDARDPGNDVVVYLRAMCAAHTHDVDGAIGWLTRLDALGSTLVPTQADLVEAAQDPRFGALVERAMARAQAVTAGVTEAYRGREPGLRPEGVAHDAVTGALFVGALDGRKIVRIKDGRDGDFAPATLGLPPVIGLRVDAARRRLWAGGESTASKPRPPGVAAAPSELLAFDLDSGALVKRYPAPATGKHLINDVAIGDDGAAFVTDSEDGSVWGVRSGDAALRPIVPAARFSYPNGIAWDGARRALLVADTVSIWRVDPATGASVAIAAPPGVSLAGLDGMYLAGDRIIGVQNLVGPGRVVVFELDADHARVTRRQILLATHPTLDAPTTGAVTGDAFYLLANSQIHSPRPPAPVIILRVPLPWASR